jgi:class 3 adenylate cyclase
VEPVLRLRRLQLLRVNRRPPRRPAIRPLTGGSRFNEALCQAQEEGGHPHHPKPESRFLSRCERSEGFTARIFLLAEFGSAVEAVSCAVAVQQELSNRTQGEDLKVRIGIHLGDVVDKAGDLFGTAVNVAARLEGIAQPGGIVVSAAVRDAIAGKLATSFADLGLQALKNIEEPVKS